MKKWRCTVCNYVHEGETPPEKCPICGVGPDKFELVSEVEDAQPSQWRCVVCNYIHDGPTPPEKCPICGVGPDKFVLVERAKGDLPPKEKEEVQALLFNVSYGLYIVSSINGDAMNAMTSNSFIQVTDSPLRGSVCIGKGTLTHDYIKASGVFGISILGRNNHDLVKHFGYQSGRDVDKFKTISYVTGEKTSCPGLLESICFIECEVEQTIDLGTHDMFIAKVVGGSSFSKEAPMTYANYRASR
ncbi:MAG: flavin reductase [Eubacteriaceae bacterium]